MEKELIHKDCGGEIEITTEDNGACGDPECCPSGATFYTCIKCKKCKKHDMIL